MMRTARLLTPTLAVATLLVLGTGRVSADHFVGSPGVSCCSPPAVSYYTPAVVYRPAPVVSYYVAPSVSYYVPSVSYYSGPTAVTTTRYGLFGRRRVTTTYYP